MSPQKSRAVPRPRRRPRASARPARDTTHRDHDPTHHGATRYGRNHADAAAQSPPPNFPPESANPETVFAASRECRARFAPPQFGPLRRAYQRIRQPPDRKTPPPSHPQSPAQSGSSSGPPSPHMRRDKQLPRKHNHPAHRKFRAAPPENPGKPRNKQSHASV